MNDLLRGLAPVSDAAWKEIDNKARRTLTPILAARKLVDFKGPLGWRDSAVGLGRVSALAVPPRERVTAAIRQVQARVELRAEFTLSRPEIEVIDRGGPDPDLDPVREAARAIGLAEDRAVFHGYAAAGIKGINDQPRTHCMTISTDYEQYPRAVAEALNRLRNAGVDGPYAIALGPRCYTGVIETTERGGYPVFEHLRLVLGGAVLWAPGVDGAVVMSQRGGDFELTLGEDVALGYLDHDAERVHLFLEESFTFQVLTPEAAVHLAYVE